MDVDAKAGDHDFHIVSLTPSVTLFVDFDGTDDTDPRGGSFYRGTAHVCLKDAIFQPSTAERHAVELISLLNDVGSLPPVMFVMTDGGPDHNCRHLSVQMSWLGFFLLTGMDMLAVSRGAPTQSWTNPAERVMSTLNLSMQNMALAREKQDDEFEAVMRRCNGMNVVRAIGNDDQVEAQPDEPLVAVDGALSPPLTASNSSEPIPAHDIHGVEPQLDVQSHGAPEPALEGVAADSHHGVPEDVFEEDEGFLLVEDDEVVERNESGGAQGPSTPPLSLPGFKAKYRASITPVMSLLERQIRRSTWCEKPVEVHACAKDNEVLPSDPSPCCAIGTDDKVVRRSMPSLRC